MKKPTISAEKVDISNYQHQIIKWFGISTFISGFLTFLFGFFTDSNYWNFSLAVCIYSFVVLLLIYYQKFKFAGIFQIFCSNLMIVVQCTITKSAYLATLLGFIFIVAIIVSSIKFAYFLFAFNFVVVLIYVKVGIFTIMQTPHPETGVATVDNISVLMPVLIISFAVAYIISKILLNLIQYQSEQYKLLKKTQDQLFNQKKLESIQILAGGIAHDFNNILTSIIGNINLLQLEEGIPTEALSNLDDLEKAAATAKNLTNKLLLFSKGTSSDNPELLNFDKIVVETANFAIRGRKSKILFQIEPNLWPIVGIEDQLSQLVQNLVINADEAQEDGGSIEIRLSNTSFEEDNGFGLKKGDYIELVVTDHGSGISEDAQEKIFSPFFTTKLHGTGLGLAICYNVVTNHLGKIFFDTKSNGTSFIVILPAEAYLTADPLISKSGDQISAHYSGGAIIVDDKKIVRKILTQLLGKFGFSITSFSNGADFLGYLHSKVPADLKLIILDLTIPGEKGGIELARKIREQEINVKIVLSSGYNFVEKNVLDKYFDGILKKPYTIYEMGQLLDELFEDG